MNKIIRENEDLILNLCNIIDTEAEVYVVGSVVREDNNSKSDLDIVVITSKVNNNSKMKMDKLSYKREKNISINISIFGEWRKINKTKTLYGLYDLSRYNLKTGELVAGKDDNTFLAERQKYQRRKKDKKNKIKQNKKNIFQKIFKKG